MALTNTVIRALYNANGINTDFAIPGTIIEDDSAETLVYTRDPSTDPITEDLQVEGALNDYTLVGASPPTTPFDTTVRFNVAPANGLKVLVIRRVAKTQSVDVNSNNTAIPALTMETAWDRAVAMAQELQEQLNRTPKLDITSAITSISVEDPSDGFVLGWTGNRLENLISVSTIEAAIQAAIDAANSAAASAADAAASAAAAASSGASGTAAAASAAAAATSASAAASSASAAATSETNAASSASAAATSATAAASSATSAASSASAAATSATNAASSATSAASSASSASTSATAAAASASAAATSASNAATSETNAAASAAAAAALIGSPATANTVLAGPTSGGSATAAFRALVGADLPNPAAATKGGVFSYAAVSNQFLTSISTGGAPASAQPSFTNLSGSVAASQMPALSGDVTTSAGAVATTIGANKVTLAMMAQVATASFLGRTTAGTGNVEALTATQATALLNVFGADSGSGGVKGLAPATVAGDSAKFLKGDGTWATPAGGGGFNYTAKTANYTAVAQDYVNYTSGTADLTLPTAVGIAGQSIKIKNSGTGLISILTTSSQTIDGIASNVIKLSNQYEWIIVTSDGANWMVDHYRFKKSYVIYSAAAGSGLTTRCAGGMIRVNVSPTTGGNDLTSSQDNTDGVKITATYKGWLTVQWGVDTSGGNSNEIYVNGSPYQNTFGAGAAGSIINSHAGHSITVPVAAGDYAQIFSTGGTVDTLTGAGLISAFFEKEF